MSSTTGKSFMEENISVSDKIWIYGNGSFAQRLANSFTTAGIEVLGFFEIDSKFRNESRLNSFDPYVEIFPDQKKWTVVLGIGNAYADLKNISTRLKNDGYEVIYPLAALRLLFLKGIEIENYWMTGDFEIFDRCQDQLENAYKKLSDERSRNIFTNILEFRKSGDPFILDDHDPTELSYLPSDVPWISKNEILENVIDAGSYDGDTLKSFLKAKINIKNWWCFEPDLGNFAKLNQNRVVFDEKIKVTTIPCALWSKTEILTFANGGDFGTGSAISKTGTDTVVATSLDEICNWEVCSLIKMDIEGAELDALKGALNTIKKTRPKLAICVYHKPTDLWEITNYLADNFKDYNFYLRTYYEQTFETVLYAVPN